MEKPLLDKDERFTLRLDREHGVDSYLSIFIEMQKAKREFGKAIQQTVLFRFIDRVLTRFNRRKDDR